MTYQTSIVASALPKSASVAVLRCNDHFAMNPDPLARLFSDMPAAEAEDIVCRVLEDIAQRLDVLHDLRLSGAFADVQTPARRVAAISLQIGLTTVATAAEHVACAASLRNGVALGATVARLERAFDAAVSEVWDFRSYQEN